MSSRRKPFYFLNIVRSPSVNENKVIKILWHIMVFVVFFTSSDLDENPLMLKDTIEEIYSYKYSNENPPNKWVEIVDNIKNEKDRTALTVEHQTDSTTLVAKMQTIMVYRKHLPMRILIGSVLPVIACPEECDSVIILPSEYWSNEFIYSWLTEL